MIRLFTHFILLSFSLSAAASDDTLTKPVESKLNNINACLIQQNNSSGEFTQKKFITILDTPIVTSGHFKSDENASFTWHQTSPIDVRYILDNNQLYRVNQQGSQEALTLSGKQIEFTLINTLIKATLGEFDVISNQFSIQVKNNQCNWSLTLKPLDKNISSMIENIIISGNQSIKQLNIHEVSGDRTEILLTQAPGKQ